MTSYRLTPRAERDLDDIYDFTATRWSVEQADRYVRKLVTAFEETAREPLLLGRSAPGRPTVRLRTTGSHLLCYVVDDSGVTIVRILHKRMDVLRHLGADDP